MDTDEPLEWENALYEIRWHIVRNTQNPEEVNTLLAYLHSTNWEAFRARLLKKGQQSEEEYQQQLRACSQCEQPFPRQELTRIAGWNRTLYCATCAAAIRQAHSYICQYCHDIYVRLQPQPRDMEHCRKSICEYEHTRVVTQNVRARKIKEPANLTLKQWAKTLNHFHYKCAYCQKSYEACDHFVPLGMGIGSVAQNCVPSCYACNLKKGNWHPDAVSTIQNESMQAVRHYLESLEKNKR